MVMNHYLPEQQYLGKVLMQDIHEETGTVYLEIVQQFDLTTGLYLAEYFEVPVDGEAELVYGKDYTPAELEAILGEEAP